MLTITSPGKVPTVDRERVHDDLYQLDTARDHVRTAIRAMYDLDTVAKARPVLLRSAASIGDEARNRLVQLEAMITNEMHRLDGALAVAK